MLRQRDLVKLEEEKRSREKRFNEVKPRRLFLEKLVNEREGINTSVKGIMGLVESGDSDFSKVRGILSELVNVNENYEESVEAVLGELAQAIIVEDKWTRDRVISYLKEHSMESVNIIVMEEVSALLSSRQTAHAAQEMGSVEGILFAEDRYRKVFGALAQNFLVARPGEDIGKYFDSNISSDAVIIGEKGEVFRSAVRRSRNFSDKEVVPVFGRQEKVNQMLEEENALLKEVDAISSDISALGAWVKEASQKRERIELDLRQKQMEFADVSSRKLLVEERFNSLEEDASLIQSEINEETSSLENLYKEKTSLEQRLKEMEAESASLRLSMEDVQREMRERAKKREDILISLADIKGGLASLIKDEENLLENVQRDKDACSRMASDVEDRRSRISESGEKVKSLRSEMELLERRNAEQSASVEVKKKDIESMKGRKDELSSEIEKKQESLKSREIELEDLRNKARDIDIMKKEIEYKRESLAEKIRNSYKIDIVGLEMEIDPATDWDQVEGSIADLRSQLEKMGDVSLDAVEEHKQLKDRFDFLTKQRDDLEHARESLIQAITKINRTTKTMFMETFEKIRVEFNDYFKMLFNGGKADIVLEDETNMLECGIDIIVRPPGKKLHNIMQLSGGEKAMTAIALIFAIFKVNPSPFCILDEIDAPLDESNIVRFCTVLKEFLKLSQFIIVTHNRMTIQLADVLYGITMGEKGVSKVVSVKFSGNEDLVEQAEENVPVEA